MRFQWWAALAALSVLCPTFAVRADNQGQGMHPYRVALGASALASGNQDSLQIGSGFALGVTRRLGDSSLSLGLDTGFVSSTDLAALFNFIVLFPFSMWMDLKFQSLTMVPVLATVMVRKDSGWWHPYAGVSAGPAFIAVKAFDTRHSQTAEGNIVYFMALARGGMDFDVYGPVGINIEPVRLGIFHDQFAWNPQVNLVVSF